MEQIYKTIDLILQHQKKARQSNDYLTLMVNAEALLEFMSKLINYSVEQESEYRKFEAGLIDEKDGEKNGIECLRGSAEYLKNLRF